jgi:hypothetical protein
MVKINSLGDFDPKLIYKYGANASILVLMPIKIWYIIYFLKSYVYTFSKTSFTIGHGEGYNMISN